MQAAQALRKLRPFLILPFLGILAEALAFCGSSDTTPVGMTGAAGVEGCGVDTCNQGPGPGGFAGGSSAKAGQGGKAGTGGTGKAASGGVVSCGTDTCNQSHGAFMGTGGTGGGGATGGTGGTGGQCNPNPCCKCNGGVSCCSPICGSDTCSQGPGKFMGVGTGGTAGTGGTGGAFPGTGGTGGTGGAGGVGGGGMTGMSGTGGVANGGSSGSTCAPATSLHPPDPTAGSKTIVCPTYQSGAPPRCDHTAEHCCQPKPTTPGTCAPSATSCATGELDWACQDPADCGAGMACCGSGSLVVSADPKCANEVTGFAGTMCAAACPSGSLTLCSSNAECAAGHSCVPFVASTVEVGACSP